MLSKVFSPNPFKTFYIVFTYILIFALWWAYLLYEKNETAYKEKIELNRIQFKEFTDSTALYSSTQEFKEIHSKYLRQKVMILTEGSVFILLLVVGLFRVRKVFLEEMKLADRQRNFMLSITHELKSPLSTIKLSLQTLNKRKLESEKSERLINNSLVDLDRLETLVDNILFAAKIEREHPGLSDEDANVSEIVQLVSGRFIHNKKNIKIEPNIQEDIYMNIDVMGFTSIVTNLIDNAIKYSEAETAIQIVLEQQDGKVVWKFIDAGIGIADEEKEKIFEKFYRVGNEDTRKTKGTGLGLYIVKQFIKIYGGEIEVKDNANGGSAFKLTFPQKNS